MHIGEAPPTGARRKCEHLPQLDVRELSRLGFLDTRMRGAIRLQSREGHEHSVVVNIESTSIYLRVVVRSDEEYSAAPTIQCVELERTQCRYGGSRPWLRCPRCGVRRAVLYLAEDTHFGCRGCMRLVYASQDERKLRRLWRKQSKLESRLVDRYRRPKGMHWRTFLQTFKQLSEVQAKQNRLFCDGARTLLRRRGWLS